MQQPMFRYREEVYEYLLAQGVAEETAFAASELVRKGLGHSRPQRLRIALQDYDIEESFYQEAHLCWYLPKRVSGREPTYATEEDLL